MTVDILGVALGFLIGGACRWLDLPSPAPPRVVGALLVLLMTIGYVATGWFL